MDQVEDITEALVERYAVIPEEEEVPEEGEDIEVEKVLIVDAIKALKLLKLYEI